MIQSRNRRFLDGPRVTPLLLALLIALSGIAVAQESPDEDAESRESVETDSDDESGSKPRRTRIVITVDPDEDAIIFEHGGDAEGEDDGVLIIPMPPGVPDLDEIEGELERHRSRQLLDRQRVEGLARDAQREARRMAERMEDERDLERQLRSQVQIDFDGHGGELVRIGRSLRIDEDDVVEEAVVMGGNLHVRGEIEGDAVVIGGNLIIADGAFVGGDAVVIGGRLVIDPGGYVEGQRVQFGLFSPVSFSGFGGRDSSAMSIFSSFVTLLLLLFLGWLTNLVLRQRFELMANTARQDVLKSFMIGLLVIVMWLPVVVLCAITVVGIPVAIVLLIAVPLAGFVGFFAGCQALGQRIGTGIRFEHQSSLGYLLVGITALGSVSLLGTALGLLGDPGALLSLIFHIGWTLLASMAATIGLGALTVTRFGSRGPSPGAGAAAIIVPPPVPPVPPGAAVQAE